MTALSPLFLWLLPLALLPVVIHLLNRLRYRTVKWAAMMFLRTADRDASRRARVRQWMILAARCLMLLVFLLALARLQSRGGIARFLNRDSDRIVILFDRSPGMEQTRGGVSSRERALALIQQGLSELRGSPRILWIDSATGETVTVPPGVNPESLPQSRPSHAPVNLEDLLRRALEDIAREDGPATEIWIATDRRASSWIPEGGSATDWNEWAGMNTQVTLRLLDVGQIDPDPGNRALQLVGEPRREADGLRVELRLNRDRADPESVPLQIEAGGLSLREDILVEGRSFQWTQTLPVDSSGESVHAYLTLPADSNPMDNTVAVSLAPRATRVARLDLSDTAAMRATRAALLPRSGEREITDRRTALSAAVHLWIREAGRTQQPSESEWIRQGGAVLSLPGSAAAGANAFPEEDGLGVADWQDAGGVLGTDRAREPLRLDLLRVFQAVPLEEREGIDVLARLEDGSPLLTREALGDGAHYRLATLPLRDWSTLDAGFVWVPVLQRLLREGGARDFSRGTHRLGDWRLNPGEEWAPLDGDDADPRLHVGRYQHRGQVVALNRSPHHDAPAQISIDELREWAAPFDLRVFEDRTADVRGRDSRVELTSLLALLGLIFLAVESYLLTLNIRRAPAVRSPLWRGGAA
ncbi:MAG: BatA domain-containing protein [Verrucomicrobia bacterium]|nr:BatA domain-containing protein [Verrucomicrobiota bacterium]MCH8527858.1 BatA domain-containing protein [Kiritimatiellia bacterium]